MAEDDLPQDHWVSRGYQANFATSDKRVAIFDVRQGLAVDPQRAIKSNFREQGFTTFHLQVVEIDQHLPGFVIGDTPVVHAALASGRYGFRDHLALGDADFIIGPLTRRTAACLTARPLLAVRVKTRKMLDSINAIFLRAAEKEVACHPDDANAVRQTHSRLDRLEPPTILTRPLMRHFT